MTPLSRLARLRLADWTWPAAATLALLAFALGLVGFHQHPDFRNAGLLDLVYRALQLFVLESGSVAPPAGWPLEVARFLAPLIAAYATARAILALFRTQVDRVRARRRHGHSIVCGLGETGMALVAALRARGEPVVAIERDEHHPAVRDARRLGTVVVIDEATHPAVLRAAGVLRARRLLACCDDATDAAIVVAARTVSEERTAGALECTACIEDAAVYAALRQREVTSSSAHFRLALLNAPDCAAQAMAASHVPAPGPGAAGPRVAVVGTSASADALVAAIARRHGERPEARPEITLVGPDAQRTRDRLVAEHPGLDERCRLVAAPAALDAPSLAGLAVLQPADRPPAVVFVCLDDEVRGAVLAHWLQPHAPAGTRLIVLARRSDALGELLGDTAGQAVRVVPMIVGDDLLDRVVHGTHETLGRAIHDHYRESEAAAGRTLETNPSMAPWEDLSESLREANRRQAAALADKLAVAGCTIVPAPAWHAARVVFTEAEVERLARLEHERWMAERLEDGWVCAPGPKDPARKTHPSLVAWDVLPDGERDKNREAVSVIPALLAQAGFAVRRQGA